MSIDLPLPTQSNNSRGTSVPPTFFTGIIQTYSVHDKLYDNLVARRYRPSGCRWVLIHRSRANIRQDVSLSPNLLHDGIDAWFPSKRKGELLNCRYRPFIRRWDIDLVLTPTGQNAYRGDVSLPPNLYHDISDVPRPSKRYASAMVTVIIVIIVFSIHHDNVRYELQRWWLLMTVTTWPRLR